MDEPVRIGRYALVRRVGAGGFATVWLARDEQLDAEVAVKILSENWVDEEDVRRRFLAEGRFLRRVDSPHVVGVHDIGEVEDGRPYLVLTYADGGSLADRIKEGPLDVAEAVRVVTQVGEGLKHLHNRGVLHRDVKPANVLFRTDPDGDRAMLGDLGLGKALENVSQLTMPGGTPAYVAPEQVMGDRLDHRADLYSLGAVAYAALTGQAPHGVISLGAVMRIEAPPPAMTTIREEVPDAVDAVVRRALEPDRDKRWPDLDSFLKALDEAHTTGKIPAGLVPAEELPVPAGPAGADQPTAPSEANVPTARTTDEAATEPAETPTKRSGRAWVLAALVAVVLAAAGGFGGYWFVSQRPTTVTDKATKKLSVAVPPDWKEIGESNGPALLVAPKVGEWSTNSEAAGVYLGVKQGTALPTQAQTPQGCRYESIDAADVGSSKAVTFGFSCGSAVLLERYVQFDGQQLQVQVRGQDRGELEKILASAKYTP